MLLGKRPRAPVIRRTTSMSGGMAVDMQQHEEAMHPQPQDEKIIKIKDPQEGLVIDQTNNVFEAKGYEYDQCLVGSTTTNNNHHHNQRTNTIHVIHTPHFLRTCGLCRCRLAPGRDIYMYRGDTAFCSLECREKQMIQDQRKEKYKVASDKEGHRASPPSSATAKASSTKSETAACT